MIFNTSMKYDFSMHKIGFIVHLQCKIKQMDLSRENFRNFYMVQIMTCFFSKLLFYSAPHNNKLLYLLFTIIKTLRDLTYL